MVLSFTSHRECMRQFLAIVESACPGHLCIVGNVDIGWEVIIACYDLVVDIVTVEGSLVTGGRVAEEGRSVRQ